MAVAQGKIEYWNRYIRAAESILERASRCMDIGCSDISEMMEVNTHTQGALLTLYALDPNSHGVQSALTMLHHEWRALNAVYQNCANLNQSQICFALRFASRNTMMTARQARAEFQGDYNRALAALEANNAGAASIGCPTC